MKNPGCFSTQTGNIKTLNSFYILTKANSSPGEKIYFRVFGKLNPFRIKKPLEDMVNLDEGEIIINGEDGGQEFLE